MTVAEAGARWRESGVSVIPIAANKMAAIRWKPYQTRVPTLDECHDWWGNGHQYGIAIICGAVSGNLEMTELESRALNSENLLQIANECDRLDCGDAWDRITTGYTQASPSGGLHLVYRVTDHDVPGNTKIAHNEAMEVLAETRGEGGYFVGAPSPGSCHPSGEGWLLSSGQYGVVPGLLWSERCLIHEAIANVLDESTCQPRTTSPQVSPADAPNPNSSPGTVALLTPPSPPPLAMSDGGVSPGDHWASQTDWADILEPVGWELSHTMGAERFWTRPGKDRRNGASATTDYQGKPGLYVFSTSAGLPIEEPLTKFYVYAHYAFSGNMSLCAQELVRRGYGSRANSTVDLSSGEVPLPPATISRTDPTFSLDEMGAAQRLAWKLEGKYYFVREEGLVFRWDNEQWQRDYTGFLARETQDLTTDLWQEGLREGDEKKVKFAKSLRTHAKLKSLEHRWREQEGVTISAQDLDPMGPYVNLRNGVYDTEAHELLPHDPKYMLTRSVAAAYDPEATCPKFDQFMEDVLPDPEVRAYVQRAVGYSLLGTADRRAFFLIYGPSGTGKSQFLSTMEYVFGQYGGTAAQGTFRADVRSGPTNDLHGLRGKRFVSTSETAENANFDEALLKRLSGRDKVVSRELYQQNIEWTPECSIWLATNHPPRFNSDDDAIWRRAKLVPFLTRFGQDGVKDVPDFARKYLYAEADGILNWIIQGMKDFQERGLDEPEGVLQAAQDHRQQSDSVVRFLEDQLQDGILEEVENAQVQTRELFALYEQWCRTSGERGLGSRRFANRLESTGRATYTKTNGQRVWRGLHRSGVLGTWGS